MGDVIGDLNSRRGRIEGMEARSGAQHINAFVPLAPKCSAMQRTCVPRPRAVVTTMTFDHYEEVPKNVAEKLSLK
jgi:elongation factor G